MNKKMLLVVACALGTLALVLRTAQAGDFGATVVHEVKCTIVGDDWGGPFALCSENCHTVITPNGNTQVACVFEIPDGYAPAKAEIRRGFVCGTYLGPTTDSMSIATPSGKVILVCHINGKGKKK